MASASKKGQFFLPPSVILNAAFIAFLYGVSAMATQLAPIQGFAEWLGIPINFASNFISAFVLWILIYSFT